LLKRTIAISVALVAIAFALEYQQGSRPRKAKRSSSQAAQRRNRHKPPPVTTFATDTGGRELIVRVLDVGQGEAVYIRNGTSRILIDGGPQESTLGRYLDSLRLNNTTIDVVILTHQHLDHYTGLRELFRSSRHIHVRYFFENKDPAPAVTLARLRDSISSRIEHDSLIYRDTDDPCGDGRSICTITMNGGARLHILAPKPDGSGPNNRSTAVKLVGPDSASFTMWLAGDAEHEEISWFEAAEYNVNPGMRVDVLKADHHGSCNGVSARYLRLTQPKWLAVSVGARNEYGHMHAQAKDIYRTAGVPWYRTDQNGTITIRSPGNPNGGYTIAPARRGPNLNGPSDRRSNQFACN
jgi:competence protein ComEC